MFRLVAALTFCAAFSSHALDLSPVTRDLNGYFSQQLKKDKVPGGALVVVQGDKVQLLSLYGVRKQGERSKVDENTVFRLASVSKTFASELAAIMVKEHKLNWDDPISNYLPEFRYKNLEASNQLQVQHLLSHTTGMVHNVYDNLLDAHQPLSKIYPMFERLEPLCMPGNCYGYTNLMFGLIDPILKQSANKNYSELMQQKVFDPLEMTDASLGMQSYLHSDNRAAPHVRGKTRWYARKVELDYYRVLPAAGVNASISDMGQWLKAQLGGYPAVISPDVLETVSTPRIETKRDMRRKYWRKKLKRADYGLGWRIFNYGGEELIYHSGWVTGFSAELAYSKKHNIGIGLLINGESSVGSRIVTHFWDEVLKQL
ncbi:beta-lactamase family protein [Vibrio sp. JC009]|uniref:serine hydrolase domain-containing protein n=1 Tax=Vibrio sp. JC009 TaxID=2912314 RepID=UPI0023B0B98C|nr:serine hydrolase domain-containing protein [Vibrio sp. JC009]WED24866.1 beta-lactamase family protein [Vibrio sp. JC009]